ncbi:MAG: hypothetical protein ACRCTZ_12805 [Sarcina sp.]
MFSIKLDENCDIAFDKSGIAELVTSVDDVVQAIRVELEQNKGQWELNIEFGTPYLNKSNTGLMQDKREGDRFILAIAQVIKKYDEVEKIIDIQLNEGKLQVEILLKNGERRFI